MLFRCRNLVLTNPWNSTKSRGFISLIYRHLCCSGRCESPASFARASFFFFFFGLKCCSLKMRSIMIYWLGSMSPEKGVPSREKFENCSPSSLAQLPICRLASLFCCWTRAHLLRMRSIVFHFGFRCPFVKGAVEKFSFLCWTWAPFVKDTESLHFYVDSSELIKLATPHYHSVSPFATSWLRLV